MGTLRITYQTDDTPTFISFHEMKRNEMKVGVSSVKNARKQTAGQNYRKSKSKKRVGFTGNNTKRRYGANTVPQYKEWSENVTHTGLHNCVPVNDPNFPVPWVYKNKTLKNKPNGSGKAPEAKLFFS